MNSSERSNGLNGPALANNGANGVPATAISLFHKLAGFQTLIPQFDNQSAVTPKFFIDQVESITDIANCEPSEKLLVLKSRIRGDALSHVISSPDLASETDYQLFKDKFLSYFTQKISLVSRQSQFSNCKMTANEPAKVYAARVTHATMMFLNNPDITNPAVKLIFEQTKLAKFIEGLLPEYRQAILLRDPQNFAEALNYVELLQTNQNSFTKTEYCNASSSAATSNPSDDSLKSLLQAHVLHTQETFNSLSKQIEDLKLNPAFNSNPHDSRRFRPTQRSQSYTQVSFVRNRPNRFPPCSFCGRANSHLSRNCYSNPTRRNQSSAASVNNRTRQDSNDRCQNRRDSPRRVHFSPRRQNTKN